MNIKSLCMYMYNEILHSCSKGQGGPPTRGVEGTPTAQRVEVEAAGWGGAVSSGCLPCICARRVLCVQRQLLEELCKALSPVGLGRGDGGTARRVLLTPRPRSSCLSPFDKQ